MGDAFRSVLMLRHPEQEDRAKVLGEIELIKEDFFRSVDDPYLIALGKKLDWTSIAELESLIEEYKKRYM